MKKQRLDLSLVGQGFFPSREKAQAAIMTGMVLVNGHKVIKPACQVSLEDELEVKGNAVPYVSRGGLKLEKAIKSFNLDLRSKVVMDVGASTGGFTHCVLTYGARLIYAVDVGYGQFAWKLRNDPRVVLLERTNIRNLTLERLTERPDFATIDVSFISLDKVLPKIDELTTANAEGVALIKPQFEAGRSQVGKKGVIRDPEVHKQVINKIITNIYLLGWVVGGLDYSPLKGPKGNIEYLLYFSKHRQKCLSHQKASWSESNVGELVKKAHIELV